LVLLVVLAIGVFGVLSLFVNETLRKIAFELTQMIRTSVTLDWTQRESVQAGIRLNVKKILRKYGYPPDKEKKATKTVFKQAELVAKNWISA
jgi:type I restriction enzyme, R subunit